MRISRWYGLATALLVIIVGILATQALSINRPDILAGFLGVLFGFMLAYFASEGLRHYNEEKEADEILADVRGELVLLLDYLVESGTSTFVSATGSWIKSQGLTYRIPRDVRKKVLDVFTGLEVYNSRVSDLNEYIYRPGRDANRLDSLKDSALEAKEELKMDAKLAYDAIKDL